ncbi:flagellar hook-basal body complex protein FliE [Anaerosinus massiliensis]|uniref:flagellar hook-basal body complex protein FliE n=1 Tax=Massilibacillus massiliensis TaxID=1806837 RepID=UPI000B2227A2|nr:flagellar hook-basal body complex protein FliE [Massilibacillus massiliensis]
MQVEALKLTPVVSSATTHLGENQKIVQKSFGEYFNEALNNVNELQLKGQQANIDMAAGKVKDISQVIVATEKASIALQLTMQVRNKVIDAYQEVMRMQV